MTFNGLFSLLEWTILKVPKPFESQWLTLFLEWWSDQCNEKKILDVAIFVTMHPPPKPSPLVHGLKCIHP